ncbi:MAG TPA: hypothetical protein VH413_11540 [Verrucomicrobiae bacterium]|jgi:hypothetical protein|nr:hypothetical protein [Verrucomicrobiae bacterium]
MRAKNHKTTLTLATAFEKLLFHQWKTFQSLLKQLQIERPLITSVYYHRQHKLVLPGSNVRNAANRINPSDLSDMLTRSCPKPDDLTDGFAGSVSCRYFLELKHQQKTRHHVIFARVPNGSESVTATCVSGVQAPKEIDGLSLKWPGQFQNLLKECFGIVGQSKRIGFAAFPLLFSEDMRIDHIVFVYFKLNDNKFDIKEELKLWLKPLRDLMSCGVLAYESQKELTLSRRLERVHSTDNSYVTKFGSKGDGLEKQVAFLQKQKKRSLQSRLMFPLVVGEISENDKFCFYRMPRYNIPSLRALLCGHNHLTDPEIQLILKRLLESLFTDFYIANTKAISRKKRREWLQSLLGQRRERVKRIVKKLACISQNEPVEVKGVYELIEERESHRVIGHILQGKLCSVIDQDTYGDGEPHSIKFPSELFDESDWLGRIVPPFLTKVHGDLHFDNILIDAYFPDDPIFILIDPHGESQGDPASDVGKLLLSCEVGYDFVGEGHFRIDVSRQQEPPGYLVKVHIPSDKPLYLPIKKGGSSAGVVSIGQTLPSRAVNIYETAKRSIRAFSMKLAQTTFDDQALIGRADFYKGLYSLIVAESHYLQNPDAALALLSRGCFFLDKWMTSDPT